MNSNKLHKTSYSNLWDNRYHRKKLMLRKRGNSLTVNVATDLRMRKDDATIYYTDLSSF